MTVVFQLHLQPARPIASRVARQVVEDAAKADGVAGHPHRLLRQDQLQLQPLIGLHQQGIVDQLGQIDLLGVQPLVRANVVDELIYDAVGFVDVRVDALPEVLIP
ncbi:hypothetical protein D3C86_2020700 [compost metagenome]